MANCLNLIDVEVKGRHRDAEADEQQRQAEVRQHLAESAINTSCQFESPHLSSFEMSTQAAFHRGVQPLLNLLLPGKAEAVLAALPDPNLRARIEQLARKSTEGDLTAEERAEYEGYVRANRFVAILRREALALQSQAGA